ncbi:MAG: hypothetical protein U0807_07180 [Candidatus Binatia bacterium]
MGEVIAFQEIVRMRRQRVSQAVHARCRAILDEAVEVMRVELSAASPGLRGVLAARVRKLEDLAAYAAGIG